MPEPKVYVNKASAKEHQFRDGGTMLKLGFHVDTLIEFLRQHQNAKGYVNLCVARRREVSQYSETHSIYLDTFVPGERQDRPASAPSTGQTAAQRTLAKRKPSKPQPEKAEPEEDSDPLPF